MLFLSSLETFRFETNLTIMINSITVVGRSSCVILYQIDTVFSNKNHKAWASIPPPPQQNLISYRKILSFSCLAIEERPFSKQLKS